MPSFKYRFFYFGKKNESRDVLTVATDLNTQDKSVMIAFAFCNPKDRFVKKVGRTKALGRLQSLGKTPYGPYIVPWSGETARDVCKVFNEQLPLDAKPHRWQHRILIADALAGLSYLEAKDSKGVAAAIFKHQSVAIG